jgi:hypothetical protein
MSTVEKVCRVCGESEEMVRLELCGICSRYFCSNCAHRAFGGRRFCSPECAKAYYFFGEPDDEDELPEP